MIIQEPEDISYTTSLTYISDPYYDFSRDLYYVLINPYLPESNSSDLSIHNYFYI